MSRPELHGAKKQLLLLPLLLPFVQLLHSGKTFVLKNLSYDSVHRADLFMLPCQPSKLESYINKPDIIISESQPWILQQFVQVMQSVRTCDVMQCSVM
jgi:hypothetical protein